jgi:hypothetical protein
VGKRGRAADDIARATVTPTSSARCGAETDREQGEEADAREVGLQLPGDGMFGQAEDGDEHEACREGAVHMS